MAIFTKYTGHRLWRSQPFKPENRFFSEPQQETTTLFPWQREPWEQDWGDRGIPGYNLRMAFVYTIIDNIPKTKQWLNFEREVALIFPSFTIILLLLFKLAWFQIILTGLKASLDFCQSYWSAEEILAWSSLLSLQSKC